MENQELVEQEVTQEEVTNAEEMPATEVEETPVEEPKLFDKANFIMTCSCGAKEVIAAGISGGMQYVIPATDKHSLDIQCPQCLTKIKFYFEEVVEENTDSDEQVPQTNTEEESV